MLRWFGSNQMMGSPGKFWYILLGEYKPLKIKIERFKLESAKLVKLLGITIDYNLTFDTHISNVWRTASAKIKSLSRIRNILDEKQVKLMYARFFNSISGVNVRVA